MFFRSRDSGYAKLERICTVTGKVNKLEKLYRRYPEIDINRLDLVCIFVFVSRQSCFCYINFLFDYMIIVPHAAWMDSFAPMLPTWFCRMRTNVVYNRCRYVVGMWGRSVACCARCSVGWFCGCNSDICRER